MKSAMPYRGITAPELKALLRPILADPALRRPRMAPWEGAVRELWDDATYREERYAATALTGHRAYRAWQDPGDDPALPAPGGDRRLVGPRRRGGQQPGRSDPAVPPGRGHPSGRSSWVEHDDLWLRRTAIICQLTSKQAHRPRTCSGSHRAQPRRPQLLDPQGDRLGAAPVRAHRPRLGAGAGRRVRRQAERAEPARGAEAPLTTGSDPAANHSPGDDEGHERRGRRDEEGAPDPARVGQQPGRRGAPGRADQERADQPRERLGRGARRGQPVDELEDAGEHRRQPQTTGHGEHRP